MLYGNISEKVKVVGVKKKIQNPKAVLPKRKPIKSPKVTTKKALAKKRKKSKIILPDHFGGKESLQAFRTTKDVKKRLASLGEGKKSQFINDALILAFSNLEEITCPCCKGKGKIKELMGQRI